MNKAKKLEYHFAATFRERIIPPQFDSIKLYSKNYLGMIYPKNTDEVHQVISYCNKNKIKVIQKQRDFVTKVDSHFLIISLEKMSSIEIIEEDRVAYVDAGVETGELLGLIEFKNFFLPSLSRSKRQIFLDVLNDFSLGGDSRGYNYGSLSSFILGIEGVLGSGEVFKLGSYTYQDTSTSFLKYIFLNTYGQYGIITKLKLKLLPLLPVSGLFTIEAHSLEIGIKILQKLDKLSLFLEELYFFDNASIKKLSEYKKLPISGNDTSYLLLLELKNSTLEDLNKSMNKIQMSLADVLEGIISIHQTQLPEEIEKRLAWKDELELASAVSSYNQRIEKLLLPPSKIQYFISDLSYLKKDFGVDFLFSGSLKDGSIEVIFMNIQDSTGLVWNTFQHELRAKILDILYVYNGRPITYSFKEQESIESFFIGNQTFDLVKKMNTLCDPYGILVPTNQA